jgi:hypothetical protein
VLIALLAASAVLAADGPEVEVKRSDVIGVVTLDAATADKVDRAVRAADQFEVVFDVLRIVVPVVTALFLVMLTLIGWALVSLKSQVTERQQANAESIQALDQRVNALPGQMVTRADWLRADGQTGLRIDRLERSVEQLPDKLFARLKPSA